MKSMITPGQVMLCAVCALAGWTTQADAQSNITMSGNLDLAVGKTNGGAVTEGPGYFNWLAFKGTEQINDDLQAVFYLETRFDPSTGGFSNPGTFWQGESRVGIKSATLGTLRLGRAMTPMWQSLWRLEPWGNGATYATLSSYQTGSYSSDGTRDVQLNYATFARINNGVFYDSPSWSGLHFSAAGEAELADGASRRNKGLAVNFDGSALTAMVSYEKNHESDSIAYAGATYVLGGLKLFGSYAHTEVLNLKHESVYLLAATYALNSQDALRGGYGGNRGLDSHKVSAGIVHAFSKRSSVYADLYTEHITDKSNGAALGISHQF